MSTHQAESPTGSGNSHHRHGQRSKSSQAKKGKGKTMSEKQKKKLEMEKKIRERVALEEKAFRLVEQLLENPITEEFFKEAGIHITPEHYKDVVEERSIQSVCGYPICSKRLLNVPQKKYHISLSSNKVYDITDRKKFCSNQCYKASQFYLKQISTTPLWMRDVDPPDPLVLLDSNQNRGSAGVAVVTSPSSEVSRDLHELERVDMTTQRRHDSRTPTTSKEPSVSPGAAPLSLEGHRFVGGSHCQGVTLKDTNNPQSPSRSDGETCNDDVLIPSIVKELAKMEAEWDENDSDDNDDDECDSPNKEPDKEGEEVNLKLSEEIADVLAKVHLNQIYVGPPSNARENDQGESEKKIADSYDSSQRQHVNTNTCDSEVNSEGKVALDESKSFPLAESEAHQDIKGTSLVDNVELFSVRSDFEDDVKPEISTTEKPSLTESKSQEGGSSQTEIHRELKSLPLETESSIIRKTECDKALVVQEVGKLSISGPVNTEDSRKNASNKMPSNVPKSVPPEDEEKNIRTVTSHKAQMLMELLDRREALNNRMQSAASNSRPSGSMPFTQISQGGNTSVDDSLDNSPDCASAVTQIQSPTASHSKVSEKGITQIVYDSVTSNVSGETSSRSKFSKADVLANVHRLQEQTVRGHNPPVMKTSPSKHKEPGRQTKGKSSKNVKLTPLDLIKQTLHQWKTADTVRFLRGPLTTSQSPGTDFEERYRELCQRVDAQDMSDVIGESQVGEEDKAQGRLPRIEDLPRNTDDYEVKVRDFYQLPTDTDTDKAKAKKGATSKGDSTGSMESKQAADKVIVLPPVDTYAQISHRRKIVISKLGRVFPELLGPLRLSVAEVSGELKTLIKTFNLTSSNILLKPAEWTLMAYFLLRLLSLCCPQLQRALRQETVTLYFRTMLLSLNISESDVDGVIGYMRTDLETD